MDITPALVQNQSHASMNTEIKYQKMMRTVHKKKIIIRFQTIIEIKTTK
jgi:hypothetical protein